MKTSVDTLKLRLIDFKVMPNARFCCNNNINFDGELIRQTKYINTDKFNLNLSDKGCFVQASIPKNVYGNNESPVNKTQLKNALHSIQGGLLNYGIETNILTTDLSRIDVFRGVTTRHTFDEYTPVFNLLQGKRQNKRDYGSTYLFENTLREMCFYDKIVEQKTKLNESNIVPSNSMRAEARLLNKKSVKKTGLVTANDLLQNYDIIDDVFKANVKNVFRMSIDDTDDCIQLSMPIVCQNEVEKKLIEYGAEKGSLGMRVIKEFVQMFGANSIAELMSVDGFIDTCIRHTDYKNKRELKRRLQRDFRQNMLGEKVVSSRLKTLYNELYHKFAV